MSAEKPRVLFVCTHNAARSQMAEALLRKHAGDRFEVASAGFEPTDVHPQTRPVLAETGIDGSGLHAKGIRRVRDEIDARIQAWLRAPERAGSVR